MFIFSEFTLSRFLENWIILLIVARRLRMEHLEVELHRQQLKVKLYESMLRKHRQDMKALQLSMQASFIFIVLSIYTNVLSAENYEQFITQNLVKLGWLNIKSD